MTFLYTGMDCSKSNLHVRKCSGYYKITVTVLPGGGGGGERAPGGGGGGGGEHKPGYVKYYVFFTITSFQYNFLFLF